MGPKYNDLKNPKDVENLPKHYIFQNYRECLYGLSDVVISLQKDKFRQHGVTIFIKDDDLDGIDKLYFRRPKKRQLLRKRYVDENEWKAAIEKASETNTIYYSFKEQTRSHGNHSAGKCLLDFEITQPLPEENNQRMLIVNIRASIVPYNLFFDLLLLHQMLEEVNQKLGIKVEGGIQLNVELLTIKKGASFGALICMGYHFKDLKQSKFFTGDIDHMFDNQKNPCAFKIMRVAWNNAYNEMQDRLKAGEDPKLWEWTPTREIKHRPKKLKEENNNGRK